MILYIKVGSITNAQRGQRLLRSQGYKTQIKKVENPSPSDGCGYALHVTAENKEPLKILRENSINVSEAEWK